MSFVAVHVIRPTAACAARGALSVPLSTGPSSRLPARASVAVMRAAIFNEPRSITAGERPDPAIARADRRVVRVVLACVCGSDLWYYRGDSPFEPGPIGHEFIGVVEDVGAEVADITARRLRHRAVRLQRRHAAPTASTASRPPA